MLRLMCVTAHPDDEAGGFGGTLRLYHDRGVETSVICLTRGQAASNRGKAKSDDQLATMRCKEFSASCKILKVNRPVIMDFPDGKLHRQDLYQVVRDLTFQIREFRPQVVMTFGAEGGITGHTDHSMAGVFATLAFQWAGRKNRYPDQLDSGAETWRPQKLYYATANFSLPDLEPITLSPETTVIEIGDYIETKITAFKAHKTQAPLWPRIEQNIRQRWTRELFHLAASTRTGPVSAETDLFAGVEDE